MMAAAKLAALVTLLAFIGPAACQESCFVGWNPVANNQVCTRTRSRSIPTPPFDGSDRLRVGYYYSANNTDSYCPSVESVVRKAVADAIYRDPGVGAGIIRLFFHDCFVRGCDASVLLNTTASKNSDTEREGPPNKNSLRGFEVIDAAKEATKAACGGNKVSCADILAYAARDASSILSGGKVIYPVPAGRYDGRESFSGETDQLPGPGSDLQELKDKFDAQGLSTAEMVTLSGAHTIGNARCLFNSDSLSNRTDDFAVNLRSQCSGSGSTRVNMDMVTPNALDSQYFKNLDDTNVLFDSDLALRSSETKAQVDSFATNADEVWEEAFREAMQKMGDIRIKAKGDAGAEIRETCWRVNNS
ncbi:unnamed protein product [Alopecurus aequalis]